MCDFEDDFEGEDFMEDDFSDEPFQDDLCEPAEQDEIEGGRSESREQWRPDWVDFAIFGGLAEEIAAGRRKRKRKP